MRIREHGIRVPDDLDTETTEETWLPVALMGIVHVKVNNENGPIHPGDLLTTSTTMGHAMRAEPVRINGIEIYPTGAILTKALEPLESGKAKIRALVTVR